MKTLELFGIRDEDVVIVHFHKNEPFRAALQVADTRGTLGPFSALRPCCCDTASDSPRYGMVNRHLNPPQVIACEIRITDSPARVVALKKFGASELTQRGTPTQSVRAILACNGPRGATALVLITGGWRTLQHITASPSKIGAIICAALVLTHFKHGYIK
jgi:hypothetical protein